MDVEEGHRGGRLGSSGECDAEEHVPEVGIRQTERSKNGKVFKGPGGENIKNFRQQVMSVGSPGGFVRTRT